MSQGPYEVLGVSPGADDAAIRNAYLALVKRFPPDREPSRFEEIRDAWQALRDPRQRARSAMFSRGPELPLASLLEGREGTPQFVGPDAWMAVIAEPSK